MPFRNFIFRLHCVLFVLVIASSASCSRAKTLKNQPEVKIAVIRVTSEYLQNIILAKKDDLGAMVMWVDYMLNNRSIKNKADYFKQVHSIKGRFKPNEHPFVNLDVIYLDIDDNVAQVTFQKFGQANSPEISVELNWGGGGWLVVDDSIFGRNGLIASLDKT